uniref:Uncharacterized protein n=1 Tax=Strongyloides stercoralis TaxID=6248 RepID=A0AAF5DSZ1_STRER
MTREPFVCYNIKSEPGENHILVRREAKETLREQQKNNDHILQTNKDYFNLTKDTHFYSNSDFSSENFKKHLASSQHNKNFHLSSLTLVSGKQQISDYGSAALIRKGAGYMTEWVELGQSIDGGEKMTNAASPKLCEIRASRLCLNQLFQLKKNIFFAKRGDFNNQ